MKKAILWILVIAVAGYFAYRYFQPKMEDRAMVSGDIVSNDLDSAAEHAKFLKENAGEDADGQSEHKTTRGNISAGDAPATAATSTLPPTAATATSTAPSNPVIPGSPMDKAKAAIADLTSSKTTPTTIQTAPSQTVTYPAPAATSVSTAMSAPPATDTIAPNPTNGMVFSGKGTFQWYRQGNITWRVDTVTGRSCIVFATDEEWRKPRVLSHGCGRNA